MTSSTQGPDSHESRSPADEIREAATVTEYILAVSSRGLEVALVVLLSLLICPPLLILVVVVVVPLVAAAILVSLAAAAIAAPYLLVRQFGGHHGVYASLLAQRVRHATRAVLDLLPHRIASDARRARH